MRKRKPDNGYTPSRSHASYLFRCEDGANRGHPFQEVPSYRVNFGSSVWQKTLQMDFPRTEAVIVAVKNAQYIIKLLSLP